MKNARKILEAIDRCNNADKVFETLIAAAYAMSPKEEDKTRALTEAVDAKLSNDTK